ncbi:hypothetical protein ACFE04_011555 [Oxalis oulophora]
MPYFSTEVVGCFIFFVVDELCLVVIESDVDGRDDDSNEKKVKSVVLNNGNNADFSKENEGNSGSVGGGSGKLEFITLSNGNVQVFINDSMILLCRGNAAGTNGELKLTMAGNAEGTQLLLPINAHHDCPRNCLTMTDE